MSRCVVFLFPPFPSSRPHPLTPSPLLCFSFFSFVLLFFLLLSVLLIHPVTQRSEDHEASGAGSRRFLPTSRRIVQFSNGRAPGPGEYRASLAHGLPSSPSATRFATLDDKIVYIGGSFDLFHGGHVSALRVRKSHVVAASSQKLESSNRHRKPGSPELSSTSASMMMRL